MTALRALLFISLLSGTGAVTMLVGQIPADRAGLLKGEPMGQASYAEANGYPDPRRVLTAAKELQLSPDQQKALTTLVRQTDQRAGELGKKIVSVEEEIADAFRTGIVSETSIQEMTNQIALLRGKLRTLHLTSFVKTKSLLTQDQVARYKKLTAQAQASPKK